MWLIRPRDHDPRMNTPDHQINEEPTRNASVSFLRTELETGSTFALIAEQAVYEDKINRNLENARKAFLSAQHFIKKIALSDEESAELHGKLGELERRLQTLKEA